MSMSIGEVAQKMAMSTATIRYYEEQVILPFVTLVTAVGAVYLTRMQYIY